MQKAQPRKTSTKSVPATLPPLVITFKEFYTREYPCSRAHANSLVKSGELETFVDCGRRRLLYEKAREFVERKAAAGGAVSPEISKRKAEAGRKGRALQLKAAAQ